ncbi:MAG: hypothetical protein ACE5LU_10315 [Anaerolineae bacterium]
MDRKRIGIGIIAGARLAEVPRFDDDRIVVLEVNGRCKEPVPAEV